MADYKLIKGTQLNTKQAQPQVASLPSRLGHAALQGVAAPGLLIGQGLNALADLLGIKRDTSLPQPTTEGLTKALGYTPEQVAPQSFPESFAQRLINQAPINTALAFTPLGPGIFARSAIGSLAGSGLEQLGASPLVQDIGQIAAEIGTGLLPKPTTLGRQLPKALTKVSLEPQRLTQVIARELEKQTPGLLHEVPMSLRQKATQKIGEGIRSITGELPTPTSAAAKAQRILEAEKVRPFFAGPVQEALSKISNKSLAVESRKNIVDTINHALGNIESSIVNNTLDPHKAADLRTGLYALKKELKGDDYAKYIQPLVNSLGEFFDNYALENYGFFQKLNARNKLTMFKHAGEGIDNFIKSIPKAGPALSKIGKILTKPTQEVYRFFRHIFTNPEAQRYYWDLASSAAKREPTAFIKAGESLINALKPKQEQQKQQSFRLLQGKRLS